MAHKWHRNQRGRSCSRLRSRDEIDAAYTQALMSPKSDIIVKKRTPKRTPCDTVPALTVHTTVLRSEEIERLTCNSSERFESAITPPMPWRAWRGTIRQRCVCRRRFVDAGATVRRSGIFTSRDLTHRQSVDAARPGNSVCVALVYRNGSRAFGGDPNQILCVRLVVSAHLASLVLTTAGENFGCDRHGEGGCFGQRMLLL